MSKSIRFLTLELMIPIHNSEKTQQKEIIVNWLSELNNYDFSEPHRHDYFEFFYFIKGGGNHFIDFTEFEILDNSVHVVAPGQVHQVNRALDSSGFVCLFELDALDAMSEVNEFLFEHVCFDVDTMSPTYTFSEKQVPVVEALRERIKELLGEEGVFRQLSIRALIQSMCVECMRSAQKEHSGHEYNDYARFRKLLFANFRQYKKVKEYAEQLCVTEKTLNEQVKKHSGKSASQIIYDQIILEAKRLLLIGMSAKEAAYDLNFDDPGHFSKFFKNNTGVSPSEFRKIQA